MAVPKKLEDVLGRIKHPAVTATGITITDDGRWAILAQVRPGTPTHIKEVERMAGEFPVVYEEEAETLQVASPAYPSLGE